jgi:RNA polymerase sigma-70 factor (ECF subfamily)
MMDATVLAEAFESHRSLLWGLSYRMTGCPADAEDVVQETFIRALQRPPRDLDAPLRPWLVTVALNLAKDLLRHRRSQAYPGIWLPGPAALEPGAVAVDPPQERFDLLESGSYAFLIALERFTPQQRAVFLLREVFDHSVEETAKALGITAANVKVTLHRARKALQRPAYPSAQRRELTQSALLRFQEALAHQDLPALEALFAPEAQACGDGGGVYATGKVPIAGGSAIARFFLNLARQGPIPRLALRTLNGLPTQVGEWEVPGEGPIAPRWALNLDVDEAGRILWVRAISAPRKLGAIGQISQAGPSAVAAT